MSETTSTTNTTAVATLRRIGDLLAQHPEVPAPFISLYDHRPETAELAWFLHINDKGDAAEQRETAQLIIRSFAGKWDKTISEAEVDFRATREGLSLQICVVRDAVCARRVVGTREVTIPAVEARPERVEVVEVVEWDCGSILADEFAEAVSA